MIVVALGLSCLGRGLEELGVGCCCEGMLDKPGVSVGVLVLGSRFRACRGLKMSSVSKQDTLK